MKIKIIAPIGITTEEFDTYNKRFKQLGHELIQYTTYLLTKEELTERSRDADVLILANQKLDQEIYESASKLKFVSVAFTGYDHIPIHYCNERNIKVANAAGYSTHAVAELAIGMLIELYRHLQEQQMLCKSLKDRQGFLGRELFGKTFGIVGLGAIGQHFSKLAQAFGGNVLAYNRSHKEIPGVKQVAFETLLKESDIISLHLPLSKESKNLISDRELEQMKPSAILINTARGPIVDVQALSRALQNKQIAGAAIDVYEYEPPLQENHPLLKAPNCILLPHIAYATEEAIADRTKIAMQNILNWMEDKPSNLIS